MNYILVQCVLLTFWTICPKICSRWWILPEPNYKELYFKLFRAVEDAIDILITAQRDCEELYLSTGEDAAGSEVSWHAFLNAKKTPCNLQGVFCGAVEQIRTVDLFLTKEVLCLLSYNSIFSSSPKKEWRPGWGSNPRPLAWQASALTNWATGPSACLL